MTWKIHYNGQVFGPVSDEEAEATRSYVRRAWEARDIAEFTTIVGGVRLVGLWTPGAPISFEQIDETGSEPATV